MTGPRNLAEVALAGCLPTVVDVEEGTVSFAPLARSTFLEVWYDACAATAGPAVLRIPFQELIDASASGFIDSSGDRRPITPLRLIAHTSRCGSTLMSNLLALRATTMVLKEPDFVTIPAREIALSADPGRRRRYSDLLAALLDFVRLAASGAGRDPVIKISSWTTPILLQETVGGPDISWLFLWREPGAVVASNLAAHPSWGRATGEGRAAAQLTGAVDAAPGTVEFYARTWRRIAESFLSAGTPDAWRDLSYRELSEGAPAALRAAERWFRLAGTERLPDEFDREMRRYSKGPRDQLFEPDQSHSRDPLPPSEAELVETIAGPAFTALRTTADRRLL